jgi:hypothetical protein
VHDAVEAFVDINQNWPYRTPEVYAPELSKDIAAFWTARNHSKSHDKEKSTKALQERLDVIANLPSSLPYMAMKGFAANVAPWSVCAMQWATASQHLIAMLEALDDNDKSKAKSEFNEAQKWVKMTNATTVSTINDNNVIVPDSVTPITGDGVFDWFLGNATAVYQDKGM